jgi:ring-1,2-phenylacetyl-CoA epoxidase subunit PaaD
MAISNEIRNIKLLLRTVKDPEIPVLSLDDMGIIRDVKSKKDGIEIDVCPTYNGCPAIDVIPGLIKQTLHDAGYKNVQVNQVLSPAWTSDWISQEGREKLKAYGIAPPVENCKNDDELFSDSQVVACPLCSSDETSCISKFGSTPCKAQYKCNTCQEPFEYFKCH